MNLAYIVLATEQIASHHTALGKKKKKALYAIFFQYTLQHPGVNWSDDEQGFLPLSRFGTVLPNTPGGNGSCALWLINKKPVWSHATNWVALFINMAISI